jgi:purine-binding chemotaxis protein CheW
MSSPAAATPAAGAPARPSDAKLEQYLTFELAGQNYGVEILRVQEIKGWEQPTRLPHAPDYVQGVINLRGAVVPIIDLRRRFGLAAPELGASAVVIVVGVSGKRGELTAGLVVDAVCEVCTIGAEQLRAAPQVSEALDARFVLGLAMMGERMLVLLDVMRLMSTTLLDPGRDSQRESQAA